MENIKAMMQMLFEVIKHLIEVDNNKIRTSGLYPRGSDTMIVNRYPVLLSNGFVQHPILLSNGFEEQENLAIHEQDARETYEKEMQEALEEEILSRFSETMTPM